MAERTDAANPSEPIETDEPTADIPRLPSRDPLKGIVVTEDQRSASSAIARRLR